MDIDLFNYDLFYGLKFGMDKAVRLEYGDSQMTHAMLFTGVDIDSKNKPKNGELKIVGVIKEVIRGIIS